LAGEKKGGVGEIACFLRSIPIAWEYRKQGRRRRPGDARPTGRGGDSRVFAGLPILGGSTLLGRLPAGKPPFTGLSADHGVLKR